MFLQQIGRYTQDMLLDPVGIADHTAFIDGGATGHGGQRAADAATGTALRCDQGLALQRTDDIKPELHHDI